MAPAYPRVAFVKGDGGRFKGFAQQCVAAAASLNAAFVFLCVLHFATLPLFSLVVRCCAGGACERETPVVTLRHLFCLPGIA